MVTILGLGFTGRRLAARLVREGLSVAAIVRDPGRFASLRESGVQLFDWNARARPPKGSSVFYSIPLLDQALMSELCALEPNRVVYISSTGVYGNSREVDEDTAAKPSDEKGQARVDAEARLAAGPWSTLSLRASAIYGPHRGVHIAIREGRLPRGAGAGIVSRIHVDDLAALSAAGLSADLTGAWPVGDENPCSGAEIAAWLGAESGIQEFAVSGRRVDGRAICRRLGVNLCYPSWKDGIQACFEEEAALAR